MRRSAVRAVSAIALAAAFAGCAGKTTTKPAPAMTTAPTVAAPTLTSDADRATCQRLEATIRFVSQLVSTSVDSMTQSVHPKELAKRTGDAKKNLLYAASLLSLLAAPEPLVSAKYELVAGLRRFAADFGQAQKSVARDDIATAARQLADPSALARVRVAARRIDRECGS
ncbi:MAG TPA: hypothetical protein VF232_13710 [Gaiellaceae bacterium]